MQNNEKQQQSPKIPHDATNMCNRKITGIYRNKRSALSICWRILEITLHTSPCWWIKQHCNWMQLNQKKLVTTLLRKNTIDLFISTNTASEMESVFSTFSDPKPEHPWLYFARPSAQHLPQSSTTANHLFHKLKASSQVFSSFAVWSHVCSPFRITGSR